MTAPMSSPVAVREANNEDVPSGGGVSSTKVRKRSKVASLARRWAWLRVFGSYLDYMPYYFSGEPESLKSKLKYCQHIWLRERKGEDIRWRGVGCGERQVCPLCGSYRQLVLAREASESMELAQTRLETETFGLKLVLTIPKTESARIDGLLQSDCRAWQAEVGGLFKAAYAFVGRWFGSGCGGVVGLDYTGEGAPADAHYHVNVYVFPARREGSRWVSLGRWIDEAKLAGMRAGWTGVVNEMFGLQVKDANFKASYLGGVGQLNHWLQYLYRHSLSDLWRGWQGVEVGKVKYKVGKRGKAVGLSGDDMQRIADRLRLIPVHFKRVRWFGIFSDGNRSKTMEGLGLEAVEMARKDDGDGESWVREGEPARFVRYDADGVVLRVVETVADGKRCLGCSGGLSCRACQAGGFDVLLIERLGPEFRVPESLIDYRPSKVAIGKRKRWREPGAG